MNVKKRIEDISRTLEDLKKTLPQMNAASDLVDDLNYAADHFDLSVRLFEDALGKARGIVARETVETILDAQQELDAEELIAEDFREIAS